MTWVPGSSGSSHAFKSLAIPYVSIVVVQHLRTQEPRGSDLNALFAEEVDLEDLMDEEQRTAKGLVACKPGAPHPSAGGPRCGVGCGRGCWA